MSILSGLAFSFLSSILGLFRGVVVFFLMRFFFSINHVFSGSYK